jgi:hemolysin activation/secretion protein
VDVVSAGYRFPIYSLGDSMDFIYANSSTNTPANVIAPGGTLGINGKGTTFAVRYNHNFPRAGEYSSKLVFGLDYKFINATCTSSGSPVATFPGNSDAAFIASCVPYTTRPTSASYSGQWQRPGNVIDFNVGVLHHTFPMGAKHFYPNPTSTQSDRYSFMVGRQTPEHFAALRYGGSYMLSLPGEVLFRAAVSAQHTEAPLPSGEQIGLAGSSAVRGFLERAVATDRGYFANLELYSPEYAGKLGIPGSLKAVAFYDWGSGQNITPQTSSFSRTNIASTGIGFRYSLDKDISAKFDLVRVMEGHATTPTTGEAANPGDIRGHFSITYGF